MSAWSATALFSVSAQQRHTKTVYAHGANAQNSTQIWQGCVEALFMAARLCAQILAEHN